MDIAFTVHLPVDTGSVPFIRGLCRQALEHLDVERTVVDDISLALTEACANVVQHAGEHALYEVAVSIDDRQCRISVVDDGEGFDPATLPQGDERTPLEDRVTLEKRLTPHPPLRLVGPA